MIAGNQPQAAGGQPPSSGLNLDDIYFTLFRHKWLILSFTCLGILGAIAVRVLRPPPYVSKAELMVLYVNDVKPGLMASNQDETFMPTDPGGQAILDTEAKILESLDVATNVATVFGPEKILAKFGGGSNLMAAAGVVASGIEVEIPPRTSILKVSFKHRDPDVVQPLLGLLLKVYQRRHIELRQKLGELGPMYASERDKLTDEIKGIDQQLKELKAQANTLVPEDSMRFYQNQYSKAKDALFDAQRALAQSKAMLGSVGESATPGATNGSEAFVPQDKLNDYSELASELEASKKNEREYIRNGYLDAFPLRQRVRQEIQNLQQQKADLEKEFPALKHLALGIQPGTSNSPSMGLSSELDEVKRLTANVAVCETIVSNVQAEAHRVLDIQPQLLQLQRKRDEDQRNYDALVTQLSLAHSSDSQNMSTLQSPMPPEIDYKKFFKKIGAVLGGCIGMGLGLAFFFDLVLDRTFRRSKDVERHLHLPVFLSIPDTSWTGRLRLPWPGRHKTEPGTGPAASVNGNGSGHKEMALVPWDSRYPLQSYTEGLRERLITYFEVHNLNLKKPKLVAVTGCSNGSGVTTLASGLAAELSKTGDGNVLLVDMNGDQGAAHPFYNGKPGCGLDKVLEPDGRVGAQVQENLYVASVHQNGSEKLAKALPMKFNHLVPRLKASDYDYIIFDMPPVSATSATPRLASHMDIVLLVLESEKTGQQSGARAAALMREARANVAAVLNKCRPHVPARLSPEL
jgi:uncharacterized protein involved in exopolysaccharide biosynthesis/Mrp family chromosome partitioning ATPase